MLMSILAIAAALVGGWTLAFLIEVCVNASRKLDREPRKARAGFRPKLSLWSFVLLLFTPVSSLRSLTSVPHQSLDLGLTK